LSRLNIRLYNNGVGNIILSCAGLIPGYWVSVATIDTIGRKPIQIGGFAILTILFSIIGFGFKKIPTGGLFALYCLANFFQNFGPNTTTFIVPGEVFPTRYRSTGHGISAASGKTGAIIAQALIGPLRNRGGTNNWLNHVMEIFALFMYAPYLTFSNIQACWGLHIATYSGDEAQDSRGIDW
jgi:MFS transporter, PHS family, inorganic phosphate transporter